MSATASRRDWRDVARSALRWLPGVIVTSLAFWFLARGVDWGEFLNTLVSIPPGTLLLTVVLYLITMVARALCWQTLLQRRVSPKRAVLVMNEGYFLNNILPFRLGELGRALLMGKHSQLGMFHVLSTIVVERSYDLAFAAGLLLMTLPLVLRMESARPIATLLLVGVFVGLFVLYLIARNRQWVEGRLEKLAERWPFVARWILPPLHSVIDGFSVLTRPEFFVVSFAWLGFSWGLSVLRDWALLQQLAPGAPVWWAALAISASNLGGALPSVAASLGVFEAAAVYALGLVGVSQESALAYALIVHVIHLISSSLIGAIGLSQEGKSLTGIIADLRSAKRA